MSEQKGNSVVGGFLWSLAEKVGSQGIQFFVTVVLARLLLPEQYGIIAMTTIFMAISNLLIDAGFSTALIQKKDADDLDFNSVFIASSIVGAFIFLITYFIAPYVALFFKTEELTLVLRVMSISFFWSGYYSVLTAWVTKKMLFKKFFYRSIVANIVSGIVGIYMAYSDFGVWALIGQSFTAAIVGIVFLQLSIEWRPSLSFSWERTKALMSFGSKIFGASVIGTFFEQLKGLLVGRFYTPADLALFNKGVQLPKLINDNIGGSINRVLFPAMSQYANDREKIKEMTRKSIRISSYVSFFVMITICVICEPLVRLLFTDKWIECVPYMQLVCIQMMISIVSTANLQAMKAIGAGDMIIKLEIYKKPVFFIMTVIGVYVSVYALAVTLPLYTFYATIVNMGPNSKLLNYSYREQLADLKAAVLLSIAILLVAVPISFFELDYKLIMVIQILLSTSVYWFLSYMFKVEGYLYVKDKITSIYKH